MDFGISQKVNFKLSDEKNIVGPQKIVQNEIAIVLEFFGRLEFVGTLEKPKNQYSHIENENVKVTTIFECLN